MTITLRGSKGSALTTTEMDGNFSDLDTRTKSGWNDLVGEIGVRGGSPNAPTFTNYKGGLYLYSFDSNSTNECFIEFHVNHDYVHGTMMYPHMHFIPSTNNSGVVRWGFEYTWARRSDSTGQVSFPSTNTLYVNFTVSANQIDYHHVAEMSDGNGIPGTGIETDAVVLLRVFRDAGDPADTYPDPVFGFYVDLHYQCDHNQTPLRTPPFY